MAERSATGDDNIKMRIAVIVAVVVILVAVPFFVPVTDTAIEALEALRDFGLWGLVVVGLSYIVFCALMLPGAILTLGAGFIGSALWPGNLAMALLVGGITALLGSTLGAVVAFVLSRTVLREVVAARIAKSRRVAALDDAIGMDGFKMVLLIRLSPLIPYNLLNYALGLTQVTLWNNIAGSMIGMIPGTMLYVYLGATAHSLATARGSGEEITTRQYVVTGLGLLATIVIVVVIARYARKALREAAARNRVGEGQTRSQEPE